MTIPIWRSIIMKVRALESPPYHLTSKKTIWITNRWIYYLARHAGTSHYKLQGFHCQNNRAMLILSLHILCFQVSEIQPGQWHHHCPNAKCKPSTTNYLSLTVHLPPRHCRYPRLVEKRMFHNPTPVRIRMFLNTKWLLLG